MVFYLIQEGTCLLYLQEFILGWFNRYLVYLQAADRQKIDIEGNLKNLQKKIESFEQEKSGYLTEIKVSWKFDALPLLRSS